MLKFPIIGSVYFSPFLCFPDLHCNTLSIIPLLLPVGVENVTVGFSKAQLFAQFRDRAERWGWKREYMYDTSLLEYNEPWDDPIRNRNLNIEVGVNIVVVRVWVGISI